VTDDCPLVAKRAQPRQQLERDLGHPGSVLFSDSGSATKRTTALGNQPRGPWRASTAALAFTPPVKVVSNERRIVFLARHRTEVFSTSMIGRFRTHY